MDGFPPKLKDDIRRTKDRLRSDWMEIAEGRLRKRAETTGRRVSDLIDESLDRADRDLEELSVRIHEGAYGMDRRSFERSGEVLVGLKGIRDDIRDRRGELTGAVAEDRFRVFLRDVEEQFDALTRERR